jgi:hypothetical protein
MDEQWNMWVKVGVRKLVSTDGATANMTEEESKIVKENNCSTFKSPSTGARQQPALDNPSLSNIHESEHAPSQALWNLDDDDELNQSGSELLNEIGWGWIPANQKATNTTVSNW